jgi:hypothetical protein
LPTLESDRSASTGPSALTFRPPAGRLAAAGGNAPTNPGSAVRQFL